MFAGRRIAVESRPAPDGFVPETAHSFGNRRARACPRLAVLFAPPHATGRTPQARPCSSAACTPTLHDRSPGARGTWPPICQGREVLPGQLLSRRKVYAIPNATGITKEAGGSRGRVEGGFPNQGPRAVSNACHDPDQRAIFSLSDPLRIGTVRGPLLRHELAGPFFSLRLFLRFHPRLHKLQHR